MDRGRSITLLSTSAALAAGFLSAETPWRDLAPIPVGVAGGVSAVIQGRVVYAGGTTWTDGVKQWLRDVRVYEPGANSWRAGPELPEPLAYGAKVSSDAGLEVLGGLNQNGPSRNCWRLDVGVARWSKTGLLPQDSVLSRVERIGGVDYLFGGCSDAAIPMHCTGTVWRRERSGEWIRAGEMPDGAVSLRASAALDGYVYLFGGCSEVSDRAVNHDSAFRYDPVNDEWRKLRPLPVPVRGMSASGIAPGRILLAGGYQSASSDSQEGFSDEVWIYDVRQDRYARAASLPFAVSGIDLITHDGLILALGGEDRMRSRSRRLLQGKLQ